MRHPSSSFKKRTANSDQFRTIENSISGPFQIDTPLPLIPELIAQVKDAEIFSKVDVRQGYNNVCIKKGDEHKATFKTKYGLFEPLIIFFKLKNSPSTFQAMMDQEFQDIIEEY
jgi:hypothetical protein